MEKNNNNNKINRRDFFKLAGAGTLASATALYGCSGQKNSSDSESAASGEIPTDKMVYRTNPTTGDRVSILGYGCMRWPTRKRADGNGDEVDQETVNELVDYAIAHGVNYFDTSPVYVQGWSEKSTGIALKRHPREKFLIATKLSNFSNYTRENSIAMYRKSFEDLQVDYLDYYLLHSVGNGGIKTFRARYIDNGMIDFLMEERKAGRIRNLGFSYHGTVDVFDEILAMHDRIHWDFVQIQAQLCRLETCFGQQRQRRISVWRTRKARHTLHHHGTAIGRTSFQTERSLGGTSETAPTAKQYGFLGFPLCRNVPQCADSTERHDVYGAFAGQPPHFLPSRSLYGSRNGSAGRYGADDARLPHHSMQRLQILHALPLRTGHPGHSAALQPMRQ